MSIHYNIINTNIIIIVFDTFSSFEFLFGGKNRKNMCNVHVYYDKKIRYTFHLMNCTNIRRMYVQNVGEDLLAT